MEVTPKQATVKGPAEWFTGDVWIDPVAMGPGGSRPTIVSVHFTPGARTAWHAHDGGQTLHISEGRGLVQSRGEPVAEVGPGDVVWTPGGEEHWHGAAPDHFMTHLAVAGGDTRWGAQVTDGEYGGRG